MGVFEAIVVFACSWWLIFLPSLSAGTRSQHESGSVLPGTERAAPERISWRPKVVVATAGATLVTLLIWLTLRFGWLAFMIPKD